MKNLLKLGALAGASFAMIIFGACSGGSPPTYSQPTLDTGTASASSSSTSTVTASATPSPIYTVSGGLTYISTGTATNWQVCQSCGSSGTATNSATSH